MALRVKGRGFVGLWASSRSWSNWPATNKQDIFFMNKSRGDGILIMYI